MAVRLALVLSFLPHLLHDSSAFSLWNAGPSQNPFPTKLAELASSSILPPSLWAAPVVHNQIEDVTRHMDEEARPAVERAFALLGTLHLSQEEHGVATETAALMAEALSGDQEGVAAAEGIIAALFARAVQESQISIETIDTYFGPAVADLTQNSAEIVQLTADSRALLWNGHEGERVRISPSQAENLRNLLVTMSSDWRVVTLTLVHHVRRLSMMVSPADDEEGQDEQALSGVTPTPTPTALAATRARGPRRPRDRETFIAAREALDVYAPLAHRLGMYKIKYELENLGFRHLYPHQHRLVSKWIAARDQKHQVVLSEQLLVLKRLLREDTEFMSSIDSVVVEGRQKSPYSTWRKLHKISQGQPSGWAKDQHTNAVDRVLDAIALRIILKPKPGIGDQGVALCYHTLEQVHDNWAHMDFRVKDYIRHPKENGYQALHTTCTMRYHGREWPFEVQVRTQNMHRVAEWGKAAHFRYKEGGDDEKPMQWLQDPGPHDSASAAGSTHDYLDSLTTQRGDEDSEEALSIGSGREYTHWLRHKLRNDRVFVFGSDGDIWDLERGFTARDAMIHGNRPVSIWDETMLRVNGRLQRADYTLQNGDVVTSSPPTSPPV